jgi:hypothetical protein
MVADIFPLNMLLQFGTSQYHNVYADATVTPTVTATPTNTTNTPTSTPYGHQCHHKGVC